MPSDRAFSGFPPHAITLLSQLAENNDRAWFAPRKERFEEELFEPLRALVADTSAALAKARIPIRGDVKSTFRIHRDVRFSADKRPYKTNVGAYLSYDGSRHAPGGLYVHIQPKECFAAVAFYGIEKALLERWRDAMATHPKDFVKVVRALERAGVAIELPREGDGSLLRMPRGFEAQADAELADYFRLRSFIVREPLTDAAIASPDLVTSLVALAKKSRPLLDFGWSLG